MKPRFVIAMLLTAAIATSAAAQIDFSDWHSTAEVNTILTNLAAAHPTRCSIVTIGNSDGGTAIRALKISDSVSTDDPNEGDVVIVAAHHAREWMSIETALYIAEQLLVRYGSDATVTAAVDSLEIWIVPVVNPDGFAYTQTTDRFWRKNRRNNSDGTFGVDLNRNWGYQWGLASGSSGLTSSDTYRGTSAWSEPEVVAVRDFVLGLDHLKTLITYHSFSQLFLSPWGYSFADADGEPTLDIVQERTINAIAAVHGVTYAEEIGYTASGETTDYMWGQLRIAAFTPEVRPGSGGIGGFDPPVSQIVPNIEENFAGALTLIHDAHAQEVWIRDHAGDTGAEPSAVWNGTNWSAAFWTSPDITTVPATLVEGATVTLNVHVHNATGVARSNVRVDAYFTDPRISLEFPSPSAVLIGSQTVTVPAGGITIPFSWTVPTGTNSWGEWHWCVGAIVYHQTDMPLTTQAERTNNVAIKNFQTSEALFNTNLIVAATNFLDVDAELSVFVDDRALPPGWRVILPPAPEPPKRPGTSIQRKARLLDAKGRLLAPGETIYLPVRVILPPGAAPGDVADVSVHAALLPLMPGKREAVGNGFTYRVAVPPRESDRDR
jgi:hypothetical protein